MGNNHSPLVLIEKQEYHYHNHIDLSDVLCQLEKIEKKLDDLASTRKLEKQMDSWLGRLSKSVGEIEKVSDQVDSKK